MDNPFDVVFDPNILQIPVAAPEPPKVSPTIGEMSQEDFARSMAGLMVVLLENFARSQKQEFFPVFPGSSGGGTTDGVVLLD